jgi:hypothetical protein
MEEKQAEEVKQHMEEEVNRKRRQSSLWRSSQGAVDKNQLPSRSSQPTVVLALPLGIDRAVHRRKNLGDRPPLHPSR